MICYQKSKLHVSIYQTTYRQDGVDCGNGDITSLSCYMSCGYSWRPYGKNLDRQWLVQCRMPKYIVQRCKTKGERLGLHENLYKTGVVSNASSPVTCGIVNFTISVKSGGQIRKSVNSFLIGKETHLLLEERSRIRGFERVSIPCLTRDTDTRRGGSINSNPGWGQLTVKYPVTDTQ